MESQTSTCTNTVRSGGTDYLIDSMDLAWYVEVREAKAGAVMAFPLRVQMAHIMWLCRCRSDLIWVPRDLQFCARCVRVCLCYEPQVGSRRLLGVRNHVQ
jgi:hypothetical protein